MIASGTVAVAFDTASDVAGVCLWEGESLLAEATWRSRQSHSRQTLPTLEWLLERAGHSKDAIGAVFVCLGPGSYAGLRVGLSTGKALAYALEVPIVGVGRLAADAYPVVHAAAGRVVAVHAAGRAELAWGVYERDGAGISEVVAPRLGSAAQLLSTLSPGDVVVGELATLPDATFAALADAPVRCVEAAPSRVVAVARLAQGRLLRGDVDNADTLVPLYLRAPAIGPQPPV